jgi:hypothetical protein
MMAEYRLIKWEKLYGDLDRDNGYQITVEIDCKWWDSDPYGDYGHDGKEIRTYNGNRAIWYYQKTGQRAWKMTELKLFGFWQEIRATEELISI